MVFVRIRMFLFNRLLDVRSLMEFLRAVVVWLPSYLGKLWILYENCSLDQSLFFLMSCRSQETRASRHIEKCLCSAPEILKAFEDFFSLIDEIYHNFVCAGLSNISTVQIDEVLLFADIPIKIRNNALPPQHIYHLMLQCIWNLSG